MGGRSAALVALLLVTACASARQHGNGEPCELNSQCGAPLVCRLGACRNECATDRDCPLRSSCVRDSDGLGICQVPAERTCSLASDCASPLVCRSMRCVNTCATEADCPPGNLCMTGACVDTTNDEPCVRDRECMFPLRCAADARCRTECFGDRDCRFGTRCFPPGYCANGPLPDAGAPDGGVGMDASADSGPPVCPPLDGGCAPSVTHATALAAGFDFACALLDTKQVACWGSNSYGTLGSSCVSTSFSTVPVIVEGVDHVTTLRANGHAACAIQEDGTAHCWGANGGALLPGDTRSVVPPTPVALPGVVTAIAPGQYGTYAIVGGSELYAWGSTFYGALGDGHIDTSPPVISAAPVDVGAFPGALEVVAYRYGGCVLATSGVSCWGQNGAGQAGLGDMAIHGTPALVSGLASVDELVGYDNAICARSGMTAQCWGSDTDGECGDGSTAGNHTTPAAHALTDILSMTMGTFSGCARHGASTVTCWGMGRNGELGDGTGLDRPLPGVDVVGLPAASPVSAVTEGGHFGCAVVGGAVYCWGENMYGVLGLGAVGSANSLSAIPLDCLP